MNWLINIFFPNSCLGCGKLYLNQKNKLCFGCLSNLDIVHMHPQQNHLFVKLCSLEQICGCMVLLKFRKKSIVQRLVHALKYQNQEWIGRFFAEVICNENTFLDYFNQFDLIIPVPVSKQKNKIRGYNQLHIFCKTIANKTGQEIDFDSLKVKDLKKNQAKKKQKERWENPNPFYIGKATRWKEYKILLIDDVLTTGATIVSCLKTINREKPKAVGVFCIAYNA